MPHYRFQAIDAQSKAQSGVIEAQTEREAREKLRERRVLLTSIKPERGSTQFKQLDGKNLLSFTLQLSQLLQAGLPLYESLLALELQYRGEKWHPILLSLCERVKRGEALSQAMAHYPKSFDSLYVAMMAAGESTGSLGEVCTRLTTLLDRQMKLKKQILTALLYPMVLGGFAALVLTLLLIFVIPSMESLFEGKTLNGFTAFTLGVSHFFRNYWLLGLLFIVGAIVTVKWQANTPKGKLWIYGLGLRLPLFKGVMVRAALARFTQTMATLQQGGVTLIDALHIAKKVMRSPALEAVIDRAEEKIVAGSSLSIELAKDPLIPPLVSRMLSVGEETGDTATMFQKIADLYEEEVEKALSRLMALAQPTILLMMGGMVGLVMLAVLLPLTDISGLTG